MFVLSQSVVSNSVIPQTIARQVPLSMEFSSQKYWSRFPFPGILPTQGLNLCLLHLLFGSVFFTTEPPQKPGKWGDILSGGDSQFCFFLLKCFNIIRLIFSQMLSFCFHPQISSTTIFILFRMFPQTQMQDCTPLQYTSNLISNKYIQLKIILKIVALSKRSSLQIEMFQNFKISNLYVIYI